MCNVNIREAFIIEFRRMCGNVLFNCSSNFCILSMRCLLFQVQEGGTVALSLRNIKAADVDSSVGHLTVHITAGPSFGQIVSTKIGIVSETL